MAATVEGGALDRRLAVTEPARPHTIDPARARASPRPRVSHADDESRDVERRELDHRLANSLQLAADFLIFEHMRVRDPDARGALIATADRLSAVGQMHRFLAARRHASGVDLEAFLVELGGLIGESTGLSCEIDAEAVTAPGELAQQLAIVINELAMNAAKHAYPWGERGPLHIACRRQGARLEVIVADEGRGLPRPLAAATANGPAPGGLGTTIVEAIVRQLRGRLTAENDGGARFTLSFPLPATAAAAPRSFAPPGADDRD
jgi:two-component sensor histidine kinase